MKRFDASSLGFETEFWVTNPSVILCETPDRASRLSLGLLDRAQLAVAFFASATFPLSVPGPLNRRGDTATVMVFQASSYRRRITLAAARQLALDAIRQAEERRARFADDEAARALALEVAA